jgi:hypothetical protein
MPDITDPEAVQFAEQYARPMAEMLRWFQHTANDMEARWNSGVSAKFPNDASNVVDSNATGSPMTSGNVNTIITRVSGMVADLNAANAMDGVLPATVRPLGASSGPQG